MDLTPERQQEAQDAFLMFQQKHSKLKEQHLRDKYALQAKEEDFTRKSRKLDKLKELLVIRKDALTALNELSEYFEETSIRRRIEEIITQVCRTIFDDENFRISLVRMTMRNQQEMHIYASNVKDGTEYFNGLDEDSGGFSDIVDIIIRILILKQYPVRQRVMYLDEPMKNLSGDMRERFFSFFKEICEEFQIQVIMISHEAEYLDQIDRVHTFTNDGHRTVVS